MQKPVVSCRILGLQLAGCVLILNNCPKTLFVLLWSLSKLFRFLRVLLRLMFVEWIVITSPSKKGKLQGCAAYGDHQRLVSCAGQNELSPVTNLFLSFHLWNAVLLLIGYSANLSSLSQIRGQQTALNFWLFQPLLESIITFLFSLAELPEEKEKVKKAADHCRQILNHVNQAVKESENKQVGGEENEHQGLGRRELMGNKLFKTPRVSLLVTLYCGSRCFVVQAVLWHKYSCERRNPGHLGMCGSIRDGLHSDASEVSLVKVTIFIAFSAAFGRLSASSRPVLLEAVWGSHDGWVQGEWQHQSNLYVNRDCNPLVQFVALSTTVFWRTVKWSLEISISVQKLKQLVSEIWVLLPSWRSLWM